jgi:hypothetical protein
MTVTRDPPTNNGGLPNVQYEVRANVQLQNLSPFELDGRYAFIDAPKTSLTFGPDTLTSGPSGSDHRLNEYEAGATVPNLVDSKLSATGTVCLYTYTATHLLVYLNDYHPAA